MKILDKRGQFERLLLTIFYLIFVAFILFSLSWYIKTAPDKLMTKQVKAREMALWIDSTYNLGENCEAELNFLNEGFMLDVSVEEKISNVKEIEEELGGAYRIVPDLDRELSLEKGEESLIVKVK